jgi:hypothetical protein
LAFFSFFTPKRFLQKLTKPESRFVQLGFGIPVRTSQHSRNLVVLVSFDIVEKKHFFVSGRQLFDGALEIQAIKRSAETTIRSAVFHERPGVSLAGFGIRVDRQPQMALLAKPYEQNVGSEPMQPGGEFRFSAKGVNLAE